jgi:hypothetical protein
VGVGAARTTDVAVNATTAKMDLKYILQAARPQRRRRFQKVGRVMKLKEERRKLGLNMNQRLEPGRFSERF